MSDELFSRIAKQCTLKGMQENMTSYTVDDKETTSAFLRKGVVGDWKNYFTPELNERFDREVLSKLKGTGLEFDFQM